MQNTSLKSALFITQQAPTEQIERYVVEDKNDLELFFKAFPQNRLTMKRTLVNSLADGHTILLCDPTISGFCSFCYETKVEEGTDLSTLHPALFVRVPNTI